MIELKNAFDRAHAAETAMKESLETIERQRQESDCSANGVFQAGNPSSAQSNQFVAETVSNSCQMPDMNGIETVQACAPEVGIRPPRGVRGLRRSGCRNVSGSAWK